MKKRVQAMEEEAAKLRDMQAEVEKSMQPEEGQFIERECCLECFLLIRNRQRSCR